MVFKQLSLKVSGTQQLEAGVAKIHLLSSKRLWTHNTNMQPNSASFSTPRKEHSIQITSPKEDHQHIKLMKKGSYLDHFYCNLIYQKKIYYLKEITLLLSKLLPLSYASNSIKSCAWCIPGLCGGVVEFLWSAQCSNPSSAINIGNAN